MAVEPAPLLELLAAVRVGAHHEAILLVPQHVYQDGELLLAPGSRTLDRGSPYLMHKSDMPLEVPTVPEPHATGNTPKLAQAGLVLIPTSLTCSTPDW